MKIDFFQTGGWNTDHDLKSVVYPFNMLILCVLSQITVGQGLSLRSINPSK